jgi:thioredoxin-related protein
MDKETFSDREVSEKLAKDFVTIRIHTDKPGSERINFGNHSFPAQDFPAMLGVQGLPTVVFFDIEGKPITKIPGFIKKETFLPLLKYISEGCYLQNVSFDSYVEGRASCGGRKQ